MHAITKQQQGSLLQQTSLRDHSGSRHSSVVEAPSSIFLTVSLLHACPLLAPRILIGYCYNMRRYCGTYVNSQNTCDPGSSLSQHSSIGSNYWIPAVLAVLDQENEGAFAVAMKRLVISLGDRMREN